MNKKILDYTKKGNRTKKETMEKFGIPYSKRESFRLRCKEANITFKENRGRKRNEFDTI